MSVRKIKATHAEITGDYITIEKRSMRPVVAFVTFFIFMGAGIFLFNDDPVPIFFWSVFLAIIVTLSFPGKEVRLIPRVDLIEIKSYPSEKRVTVVLDDERTKRRQPVTSPKKD